MGRGKGLVSSRLVDPNRNFEIFHSTMVLGLMTKNAMHGKGNHFFRTTLVGNWLSGETDRLDRNLNPGWILRRTDQRKTKTK